MPKSTSKKKKHRKILNFLTEIFTTDKLPHFHLILILITVLSYPEQRRTKAIPYSCFARRICSFWFAPLLLLPADATTASNQKQITNKLFILFHSHNSVLFAWVYVCARASAVKTNEQKWIFVWPKKIRIPHHQFCVRICSRIMLASEFRLLCTFDGLCFLFRHK